MRLINVFRYLFDKNKIFILVFVFQFNMVFSQKIQTSNKITDDDLTDIFEVLGVSIYKITLPESLKGKYIDFKIREFIKGELLYYYSIIDSVPGSKERIKYDDDKYRLKFLSYKGRDLENYEYLDILIENKGAFSGYKFNYIKNPREYRWTALCDSSVNIDCNSEIPLLAFSFSLTIA